MRLVVYLLLCFGGKGRGGRKGKEVEFSETSSALFNPTLTTDDKIIFSARVSKATG